MGLDIGFNVYKKGLDEKTKKIKLIQEKLTEKQEDETWACGRCAATNAWSYGFTFSGFTQEGSGDNIDTVPTFDKELDGWLSPKTEYGYQYRLKYMPFENYKKWVMDVVQEEYDNHDRAKEAAFRRIHDNDMDIKHYEELQLKCTEDNEFAFDKWQEKIDELRESNKEEWDFIHDDDPDKEDKEIYNYGYFHARSVEGLIKKMEEYQKQGFVTIPYYSF